MRQIFMDAVNGPPIVGTIRFLSGPLAGSTHQLNKTTINIGREPGNDIIIPDPSVSRHHAQIVWHNGAWNIRKLTPQNSLTVNQRDVPQIVLHEQDVISLGASSSFVFSVAGGAQQQAASAQMAFPNQPGGVSLPGVPASPSGITPPPPSSPPYIPTLEAQPYGAPAEFGTQRAFDAAPAQASLPGGTPTLEVSTNTGQERQPYPLTKQVISIGRDPSNDIVINAPTVSGFHAQIVHEGNQLVFIHPHPRARNGQTRNGIDYMGQAIAGNQQWRKVLTRGDILRISDEHGTFVTLTYNDGSGASQEALPEIRPIPLGAPLITLGRASDNTVVLNHPQVSGHHARLELMQGGYRLVDMRSTNGTYINEQPKRVSNQVLGAGDVIRIGPFKITFTGTQLTQQDESQAVRIDALHLKKTGNNNAILVNDISIAIPPRKFVALVGGSGAGKSTLLDALNGLRPAQDGMVFYNGQDYYHNLAAFSTQLGYVPQDDIIHRELSVERALYYAARLRLPNDFTEQQIQERINEVLEDVEMKARRHLLVNKLSGGQRKRVSIALELLANPSVFFLDEPTSGLDPGLDRKMMLLMRRLADRGRTIVLVTHATNNINACDYVCFLCQGGRLAYFGPPNDTKAYFGKTDFAEIYSALEPTDENPNVPAEAEMRFKQSPDFQKYVVAPLQQGPAGQTSQRVSNAAIRPPKRGNPWRQFRILSARYLELLRNDVGNLMILLLQAPIIGLILFLMAGHGTFDATSITNCPLRQNPLATSGPIVSIDCQRVRDLLNGPQGDAFAAQQGKSKAQLQQDAIAQGSGGDAQKILFIMAFAAVMFGCINGAREIVKEAPIYRRERAVNLGLIPYMFSKIVVLGVLCLLQSLVIVLLVHLKAPFRHSIFLPPVLEIYITMALTSLAGLMLGLTISAIVPNNDRAMSFVPIVLIPQVIFAGVVFSLDNPTFLQLPAAFFPARWAMAGMGSTVGLHGDKLGADGFSYWGNLFSTFSQAQAVFHLLLVWVILIVMIIGFGALIAWFLKKKDVRA
ncbi:ABC transporter ATP-binding protein [Reticulibacter mediterranei]|uniref:ABC transporter ATP-binding protein n=2 Tax=Reticulibacter mediterranei TaxID=2778369 RepID=A0A8J3IGU6_9CHLR|nr:ABC transporter ATP-binding protein [Reticulibacter mediterranei]